MKVSYEMRLKDSGIEPCQDYPQVLNRAADNVSKNYELHAFVVDSGNKLQSRFLDPAYRLMVDILYRLQKKWGIRIIDLWNDIDLEKMNDSTYELYMFDPIHPTRAGYLLWWTPFIREALIRTL